MKREFISFSMRLAGELMSNGYVLKRMEKTNKEGSRRNIFIFNESEQLLKFVEDYKERKSKTVN